MQRTALLLALARTSSLVPEGGILRGRVHVVLEGDATPPPGDAVQVVLGTSETAAGGWGDGAHPSTALCLEWLSERGFKEDESFLDYGCGSGVLAIAARKLGCREAVGVDVEYEALESAAENAERNGIVDGVDWVHGRSVVPGMDEYDAVVANILVGQLSRPSMVATRARYESRRRAVPVGHPAGPVRRAPTSGSTRRTTTSRASKDFRDPDDFGKGRWGSWARMILTRKEADRRELLERISDGAIM